MNLGNIRKRCYEILAVAQPKDRTSRVFDLSILALIFVNVLAVAFETVKPFHETHRVAFALFETVSVAIFTVEYLLRIWSCVEEDAYSDPVIGRIRYALTWMAVIDLLAILPFFLPMFLPIDLRFLRGLRLFRVFRIFKLGRYSKAMKILGKVVLDKKEELFVTGFVVMILLIIASSLMYFAEHQAQPKVFSSIFAAMWWGIANLTKVGYVKFNPVTVPGQALGALIALLRIGLFALPAGILGSGFLEEMQTRRQSLDERKCPHCGRSLTELPVDIANK